MPLRRVSKSGCIGGTVVLVNGTGADHNDGTTVLVDGIGADRCDVDTGSRHSWAGRIIGNVSASGDSTVSVGAGCRHPDYSRRHDRSSNRLCSGSRCRSICRGLCSNNNTRFSTRQLPVCILVTCFAAGRFFWWHLQHCQINTAILWSEKYNML